MRSAWLASCSEKQSVCRGSCPNYSPIRRRATFPQIQPQAVKLKKALAYLWGGGNGCHLAWKHNLGKFRWSDTENCSIHAARRPLESPLTIMTGIQDTYLHSCTALSVSALNLHSVSPRVTPLNAWPKCMLRESVVNCLPCSLKLSLFLEMRYWFHPDPVAQSLHS